MNKTVIEIESNQLKQMKDKTLKCKIIVLNEMDKSPLINPKYLSKKDKETLIMKVKEYLYFPDDEIDEKFNYVCNEVLLVGGKDLSSYPCYVDNRDETQKQLYEESGKQTEQLLEELKINKLIENNEEKNI